MAGLATDLWEFRATAGSANAGGGFDSASGGTDYSDQDAAQLQLTDLATSGIGITTLTSATGGFTAAMVGNYIQIRSGTNVVAGFYRVTVRTDTNTVTLDRAPDDGVGGIASGAGDLGGALDVLLDAFFDGAGAAIVPGSTIYVKNDGTMTLTEVVSTGLDGTVALPIRIEGYNSSRGDCPTGANRPTIACAANAITLGDLWHTHNLIFTGTGSTIIRSDTKSRFVNLKSTNSSGTAGRDALTGCFSAGAVIGCEAVSTNGEAYSPLGAVFSVESCYFHDSNVGMTLLGGSSMISDCVFDTNVTALNGTNTDSYQLLGNTFYNNTTGVKLTNGDNWNIINNIFDANTDAFIWNNSGTVLKSNHFDYNVWDNTSDISWDNGSTEDNSVKGPNAVNGDPGLTDPANGDFTLGSGSNALAAGLDVSNAGATGAYKRNIGVDQDDVSAGGGVSLPQTRRNQMIGR